MADVIERVALLPCPFCGSDQLGEAANSDGGEWWTCKVCAADGPYAASEAERDRLWNTRTPALEAAGIERLVEALEPFAAQADRLRADDPDSDRPAYATVADYRRARAALLAHRVDGK